VKNNPEIAALESNLKPAQISSDVDMVYVRKWVKTRHAIMFRLTNNTIQVNFFDTTKLVLAEDGNIVTYEIHL